MFDNFYGNRAAVETLEQMLRLGRITQTILLDGPEGVGKATLARRFAAAILGGAAQIEQDDLSLPHNLSTIADREKWPADKRTEDPLLFASHSDFVTFATDGPLRQISIQQMRLLRERAQFKPLKGSRRVFLIDRIDRANEQAANSLLKTLEEPPEHLVVVMTAENVYDLLPTIRSRSVPLRLAPLPPGEMRQFVEMRKLGDAERRIAFSCGSPGVAVSIDLDAYDRRRTAMLALLGFAAGRSTFAAWARHAEAVAASRLEKLDDYLKVLYILLEDLVLLGHDKSGIRNPDIRAELEPLARAVSFRWLDTALRKVDELAEFVRRNIQKSIALDALALELRARLA